MIVTSKFDVALEQAFLDAKEPFDVAIYMAPGTEHAGRFVHVSGVTRYRSPSWRRTSTTASPSSATTAS